MSHQTHLPVPPFYSHPLREGRCMIGGKLLTEHNAGVKTISQEQFYDGIDFPDLTAAELRAFLAEVVAYHDLFKYLTYFQAYLRGETVEPALKNHAAGGALIYYLHRQGRTDFGLQDYLGYFLIRGHHRDLWTPDKQKPDPLIDQNQVPKRLVTLRQQLQDLHQHAAIVRDQTGIEVPAAEELLLGKPLRRAAEKATARRRRALPGAAAYFLTNYLFSLLIEADKLDAARHERYVRQALPVGAVHDRLPLPAPDHRLNQLRHRTRLEVRSRLEDPTVMTTPIFVLTAPTGIGKTLTAMDFALGLRARLAAQRGGRQPLIVTALPFVNIIEQTLDVYHDFLDKEKYRIVGHFQFADVLGDRPTQQDEAEETKDYQRKLMDLQSWQADVVVTSFVQLFHTLVTGRNKQLKKFHHLAGSIIIMDEVQTLPLDLSPFLGAMLYYLTQYLDVRIVLMTATQPKLLAFTDAHLLNGRCQSIEAVAQPLLAEPEHLFAQFERTKIVPLLEQSVGDSEAFSQLFLRYWQPGQSCLIVLNTVQTSIEVYQALCSHFETSSGRVQLHYLSTNVLPVHRRVEIGNIQKALKAYRSDPQQHPLPILITTQVVEAGVDLDFDCGFRDIGPIDAIVQVAGRLNRENSAARAHSPLYVFRWQRSGRLADAQLVYGRATVGRVLAVLGDRREIPEPAYYALVDRYFTTLENQVGRQTSKDWMACVDRLDYDDGEKNGLNHFQIIEQAGNIVTVLIELPGVQEAKAAYERLQTSVFELKEKFYEERARVDKDYKSILQQHLLNVPERFAVHLPEYPHGPYRIVEPDEVERWYRYGATTDKKLQYGFQRDQAAAGLGMF